MLRRYEIEDTEFLLTVRNQPHVAAISDRRRMLKADELPEHDGIHHWVWVVHDEIVDCGYVLAKRIGEKQAVISIALLAEYANRGLGTDSIKEACRILTGEYGISEVIAEIFDGNTPSTRAFSKAGFVMRNTVVVSDGRTKIMYVYKASR